ncbi:MAG: class D beta-lactamase [Bacteroidetes bacterium]|nr:MAG: class D beta-lactamase [Bacteroidota bacterium]
MKTNTTLPLAAIMAATCLLSACSRGPKTEIRNDFKPFYDHFGVEGSFALYDQEQNQYILYNEAQYTQPFTPASTFKICNSLIAFETGVAPDVDFTIPWDSVQRNPVWDKDYDLKNAFKNSAVWYYQEIARRIGPERMQLWLDSLNYGNRDMSGGIDKFWLTGGLRITPEQQIDFLRRLRKGKLPASDRACALVQMIMINTDTAGYVLSGKTGWGSQEDQDVGWFVGYVVKDKHVYYFANCVQAPSARLEDVQQAVLFDQARRGIVDSVLTRLNLKP